MWSGSYSQQYVNPQNLELAEQELEMFMDLFSRIRSNCRNKCIPPKYHEPDLSKGEMVCIDRCVAKYISIQKMLGKKMEQNAEALTNLGSTGGGLPSTL